MKIGILKNRNQKEGLLIIQGPFQALFYFTRAWAYFKFNKTTYGWYFILRFLGVGFNFYYR